MKLIEIDKKEIDRLLEGQKQSQFLQSSAWADFQATSGSAALRYGLDDNGRLRAALSMFRKPLFLSYGYLYCPRVDLSALDAVQEEYLFNAIASIAKENKCLFLRIEPVCKFSGLASKQENANPEFQIRRSIDIQASQTSIISLSGSEEEILGRMHQKTRYNIRLAMKKGVSVRSGTGSDFESFWRVMEETRDRDGFRLHARAYYERMLKVPGIELLVAEYEGRIIAANIISYFGDMASYLHGSSSNAERNLMAPYLLQWESLRRARAKACLYYDLNGIDEKKWPGVTRFKHGFGGTDVVYPGTFDIIFAPLLYRLYSLLRKIRRRI